MDDIDISQRQQEAMLFRQIERARKPTVLPWVGHCYNCHENTPPATNFCDTDCRDDYAARKQSEMRSGR